MKRLKYIITTLLIAFSLGNLKASEKDSPQSLTELQELANQDNAQAQCNLAIIYLQGKQVPKDDKKAVEYFEKSAEQGYASAQCYLGGFYMRGIAGMKKDSQKAFEYHTKAAAQDYPNALYKLGLHYMQEEDYAKAVELFERAIKHNQAFAQYTLGTLYIEGKGVEKDESKGLKLIKMSADNNNKKAQEYLKKSKL